MPTGIHPLPCLAPARLIFVVHSKGFLAFCLPVGLGGMVKMVAVPTKTLGEDWPQIWQYWKVVFSFKTNASREVTESRVRLILSEHGLGLRGTRLLEWELVRVKRTPAFSRLLIPSWVCGLFYTSSDHCEARALWGPPQILAADSWS